MKRHLNSTSHRVPNALAYFLLFFTVLFLFFAEANAQANGEEIRHFTTRDGINNTFIWKIIQDRHGFIWTAGNSGLERFDGLSFELFRHNPANDNSIPAGEVRQLIERMDGTFLVGANAGIAVFNPATGVAHRLVTESADPLPSFQNVWGLRE